LIRLLSSLLKRSGATRTIPIIFSNLGLVLQRQGRLEEAAKIYGRALLLNPNFAEGWNNFGLILQTLNRSDEAVASYERALKIDPNYLDAINNLGLVLFELHEFDEAFANFDRAIAMDPNYIHAHYNVGLVRLLTGDFEAGWVAREWRWKIPKLGLIERKFSQPVWCGDEPLAGKTILLHSDEGLGDTILFVRYAPMVADLGAKVILEIEDALHSLLCDLPGISHCLPKSRGELPDFDFHCLLTSLPLAFHTRIETIPSAPSYLPAPAETPRRLWEGRLGPRDRPCRPCLVRKPQTKE
jgi:tetratricopeptide (TPR) repeat protein